MAVNQEPPLFSREQKTGFVLLLIFAVLAIGMAGFQIRNNIYSPFVIHPERSNLAAAPTQTEDEKLQQQDTDHDGISDYEEINFYGTSAYLPDTDSDGVGDKEEIDRGTDPNCPEGTTCVGESGSSTTTPITGLTGLSSGGSGYDFLQNVGEQLSKATPAADTTPQSQQLTPDQLKQWIDNPQKLRADLLASGRMTKEALDKVDDATLLKNLRDLLVTELKDAKPAVGASTTTANNKYVAPQR